LLPSLLLKNDDTVFLDDMTVLEVACELKTHILPVTGIEGLLHQCVSFSEAQGKEFSGRDLLEVIE
jgi:NifB/MoaA-like Fe-S oxidoreductase